MMKTFLIGLFLVFTSLSYGQEEEELVKQVSPLQFEKTPIDQQNEIFNTVDITAEYPGGRAEMIKFLSSNMKFPESAIKNNISGKVYARFVVEKDGSITDVKIFRGIQDCPECDEEAIRVIKLMPNWNPGKFKDVPVRSYYSLPIHFRLM